MNCCNCGNDVHVVINNGYVRNGYSTSSCGCSNNSVCSSCNTCQSCNSTCDTCNNCESECPGGTTNTSCAVYNGETLDQLIVPILTASALNDVVEDLADAIAALQTGGIPDLCTVLLTCDTDNLPEGSTNLYYTPARVADLAWLLLGNSGTVDGTNFLGTLDNIPMNFRVNNIASGRIDHIKSNAFFGYQSGLLNSTGTRNTNIGTGAGRTATIHTDNTCIGYLAGFNNIVIGSTFVGSGAGYRNTTGAKNTAIGYYALTTNTTGLNNTAIGYQSLNLTTTGYSNTAIGALSLKANTTGQRNVAIGSSSLELNTTGAFNVCIGLSSMSANITGSENVAIGAEALSASDGVDGSIAIGKNALGNVSTGVGNVGIGSDAGVNLVIGIDNTVIGYNALFYGTGDGNTILGAYTGKSISTGTQNTCIGYKSFSDLAGTATGNYNTALGSFSIDKLTTGDQNTAIGNLAGSFITSGANNTMLGSTSGGSIVAGDNNTVLGANIDAGSDVSDTVIIGIGDGTIKLSIGLLSIANVLNIAYVPVFADNTAALAGSLVAGDVYRTGDTLKIVH